MHPHIAARIVQELDGTSQRDMASYADIAARLVLSEKTVKSHVRNILGKLHLADRTQAAIFAWRQGLMGS